MAGKLKIAAVGWGGIGFRHQQGHLACPESELVAVCDMDVEKAEKRAKVLIWWSLPRGACVVA